MCCTGRFVVEVASYSDLRLANRCDKNVGSVKISYEENGLGFGLWVQGLGLGVWDPR